MRCVVAALVALLPVLACAATTTTTNEWSKTTWNPADKSLDIALSNGNLTASGSPSATIKGVRANKGKFSGKWCYRFAVNSASSDFEIGLAAADWNLNESRLGTNDTGHVPSWRKLASVGLLGNGTIQWADLTLAGDAPVAGKTGMVCAHLFDAEPPLFWVTSDIAGTKGHNGGPRWNGGNTADPVGEIGGFKFWTGFPGRVAKARGNGCCVFPIFQSKSGDSVTAAFAGFTPPPGYQTWDTAGGESPVPGPMDPQQIQIFNAPPRQPNHSYGLKDRVVAGQAWNGTGFTNERPLCGFAVKVAGTSGPNQDALNAACATGTPANFGSGQNGNIPAEWGKATTVVDGTVTWVLLTKVDYVTLSGALADDPRSWTPNTVMRGFDWVIHNNQAYRLAYNTAGCATGSVGPGPGTASINPEPGSTCAWNYFGDITYSSRANIFPHMVVRASGPSQYVNRTYYWEPYFKVWWGGAQRDHYHCGRNGESIPINSVHHNFLEGDSGYLPYHMDDLVGIYALWVPDAGAIDKQFMKMHFAPAPGDSFRDNLVGGVDPIRYNPAKGTAVECDSDGHDALQAVGNGGTWFGTSRDAIAFGDGWPVWDSLQFKSEHGLATGFSILNAHKKNNIMDSAYSHVDETCCEALYENNVIVSRSTDPDCYGIVSKYRVALVNNTFVSSGCRAATLTFNAGGIGLWGPLHGGTPAQYGNLMIGFKKDHYISNAGSGIAVNLTWSAGTATATIVNPSIFTFTTGAQVLIPTSQLNVISGAPGYNGAYVMTPSNATQATFSLASDPGGPVNGANLDFPAYWPVATEPFISSGNATTSADLTKGELYHPSAGDFWHTFDFWSDSFGGYGNTCGPANNQPCVGLKASDILVNPIPGPSFDATLKSDAPVKGAGSNINSAIAPQHRWPGAFGDLFGLYPSMTAPATDILGTPRPAGQVDTGAYEIPRTSAPPPPPPPPPQQTGALIEQIKLCSTSGQTIQAGSVAPIFPLMFRDVDIPAGQYPQLQAEDGTPWPATFINKRSWKSGAMKIVGVAPGPFPKAIPSDCVTVKVLSGGNAPTPSGLTLDQLYAQRIALNVDGFDGALGAAMGLTGHWEAKMEASNALEVVEYGDGPGGRLYRILTHVRQNGIPHGQMEVYWYVRQASAGTWVLPRLTQPYYNVDTPAKDWRGIKAMSIRYGPNGATLTPPYPAADNPVTISASNWMGGSDWSVSLPSAYANCGSGSQQSCKFAGYLTADAGGSLPGGALVNTIYCADTFGSSQIRFGSCAGGAPLAISSAGAGTFTFRPIPLLPHFGTIWGARADGRYTYIPGSVAEDAPILVKGNPVYEQSTKLWPPYDMSIIPDSNPSTFFSGGPVQWDLMTIGPIIQNVDQGGERDEIGARNAWCARAFYNRSPIDDKWVRLLGLVQKQFPAHVRGVTTRGLINLGDPAKSYAGFPASMANTFKWSGVEGASGFTPPLHGAPSMFGFASDNSHMPDFAGCAYLMTGEPQYLDLQAEWANQTLMSRSIEERNPIIDQTTYYGGLTYNSGWGIRLMAWSLRPFVDVDAWWPDVDPAGTQAHQYFHDTEQTSTLLPQLTIALQNNWSKDNCFWVPPGGGNRNPWMLNYMNTIMVSAYNANEDPNALWFLNCSATWYKHSFAAFGNYFNLYAGDEKAYDTGAIGSRGSLNITSAHFSWADGTATVTLDNPNETAELFDGETIYVSAAGYDPNAPHTLTRTSAITATFPLTSNPGATVGGTFQAVGKVIGSDAMYSHAGPPPTNLYQIAWNPGTPGSFAEAYNTSAGVASWNPANGDKFIFSPYIPVLAGQVPGGLLSAKPYYVVNMHKGDNCGMIWSAGTLTVTTCAAHGLAIGESYIIGINETDVPGLAYQGNYGSTLSPGPFLSNCQATGAKYFTCPVAANPGSGSQFGKFNTANLAESPGGPPLAISDANSMNPNAWDGWVAADPPAGYWVDYPWNGGYLALALNALNGMIASGVPGLAGYKADADYRFGYLLARFGNTANGFWGNNPKNAMSTCFGLC